MAKKIFVLDVAHQILLRKDLGVLKYLQSLVGQNQNFKNTNAFTVIINGITVPLISSVCLK